MNSTAWDRRSVLRAAGGLAALGALSACGSNTGRPVGGSSGKGLTQYFHAYGEAGTEQAIRRYAKDFGKAEVTTQWITGTNFESKLFSALLSSDAPDVFEFHPQIHMVKARQIVPLDDIIAPVKDDFHAADIASHTMDGKIWGIRMIDDPKFLYYRKSLLEKAGLEPPTTLDALIEAAAKLTTDKVKGLYLGNNLSDIARPMVWSSGAELLTPTNEIAYHTDELVTGLRTLRTLFTSGSLLLDAPADYWDPSAFNQGLTAMQWCGMWAMPAIQKAHGDDVGIIPFPKVTDTGRPSLINGGWSMFVSSKAKDVDLAKEYVKWLWLDRTDYQQDWCLGYGFHIPPRKSLAAKADQLKQGLAAEGVALSERYGHYDNPAFTQAMLNALEGVIADSVRDDKDPEAALDTCDKKVRRELTTLFG
ncbi:sugar ABC transporter substrate-binding protein [Streptomyces ficellus]|uniref:Sugar ABC transporter substrate-binding protein n=1 Tax=Streptomyces ficellus TaxID=1977088 RepID=A0ABT7ZDN4_9ACTN|nr:sugar ABC transporter substrate-binding protein [Streptomyces ficellus]MDN3297628.1 sugar ABC transporter substrate-binding protein [Streptomyces ficellus]